MLIRACEPHDASTLVDIYNHYIDATVVTFEDVAITPEDMLARIQRVTTQYPWWVIEVQGLVRGYAYADQFKARSAYQTSVETTVYLDQDAVGNGWGERLYRHLLMSLDAEKYHCAIGGISLPNKGSVALHEKLGFKKVAHFYEVGKKFGRWVDVGYWQKPLS